MRRLGVESERMQPISFNELIAATGGTPVGVERLEQQILRIETDSRRVQPGDLFWALVGKRTDGHKYLRQAVSAGAVAAVVEEGRSIRVSIPRIEVDDTLAGLWRFAHWYRQQFEALVIGVTGSVGKTTTRRMIMSVLSARYAGMQSPENYNNEYGLPLTLLQLAPEHEFAVVELGASQVGDIATLSAISQPEVGAITAIGPAHLDGFHSIENISRTKGELLAALPSEGFAILNGDDRQVRSLTELAGCNVLWVGEQEQNDLRATEIKQSNDWLEFRANGTSFRVPVVGRHHLTAALMAIAIGRQLEMSDEEIARGLENFVPMEGRSRPLQISDWWVIDDTYNANPLSMSAACRTLADWKTDGKRILVAGDMLCLGEWSENFHRLFGEEVFRTGVDRLIAIGSQAAVVAGSARQHGMDAGCLGVCRDHDLALFLLDLWLEPGDVVLVKGSRETKMERILTGLEKLAEGRTSPETYQRRVA